MTPWCVMKIPHGLIADVLFGKPIIHEIDGPTHSTRSPEHLKAMPKR